MAFTYIHTCYRILDPERSEDFYVNKLGVCVQNTKTPKLNFHAVLGGGSLQVRLETPTAH